MRAAPGVVKQMAAPGRVHMRTPWVDFIADPSSLHPVQHNALCGRDRFDAGAEGATAPETLRQKDREAF